MGEPSGANKIEFIVGTPIADNLQEITRVSLEDSLVAGYINTISRQFYSNVTGDLIKTVSSDNAVAGVMKAFATEVAKITFLHPVPSPDFDKVDWKTDFANMCQEMLDAQPDYKIIEEEYRKKIIALFSPRQISAVPSFFLDTGLILVIPGLSIRVAQVVSILKTGDNPEMLRLTAEEIKESHEEMAKGSEDAGKDVSYSVPNWPSGYPVQDWPTEPEEPDKTL